MIGFKYDGEIPIYLGNEIHPAVFVFIYQAGGGKPWQVCVPRVTSIRFGDHASVSTQTLLPSLAGQRLHTTFAAPSLHVHAPARLVVHLASGYAWPAYVLRVEPAPASGVFRGLDKHVEDWRAHTHEPGDHYASQHGPSSHTHDLVTGRVDTVMGEARPAGW